MKIVVPCKVVADDKDIVAAADGSLDFSKAKPIISTYDLNAIAAAAELAKANEGSSVKAITVCSAAAGANTKLRKDIIARGTEELLMTADDAVADLDAFATAAELKKLVEKAGGFDLIARGTEELLMTADDAVADLDAFATAAELKKLVEKAGGFDLIVCGDGSADLYAKQTGVQLAAALDVPYLSEVISVEAAGEKIVCKRMLATEVETVEVPLPAVIAVTPEIAQAKPNSMKDILAAGKKPQLVEAAEDPAVAVVETVAIKAPAQADRACQLFEDVDEFVAAVKAAL